MTARSRRCRSSSQLVYGVDIRHAIPLPPFPEYTNAMIVGARYFIALLHGQEDHLLQQVSYPDRSDAFFGYTHKRVSAWYPPAIHAGTKELVATVSRIATAYVAQRCQRYVPGKQQAIALFQQEIGGSWAVFVQRVFERCKRDWNYLVPEGAHERMELSELCQQMLAFENEFLQEYAQRST